MTKRGELISLYCIWYNGLLCSSLINNRNGENDYPVIVFLANEDHRSYVIDPEKFQTWTELQRMTAVIPVQRSNQLNYQANWELVTLWVRNIPVDGEDVKWLFEI